jgi:hypothetical protein
MSFPIIWYLLGIASFLLICYRTKTLNGFSVLSMLIASMLGPVLLPIYLLNEHMDAKEPMVQIGHSRVDGAPFMMDNHGTIWKNGKALEKLSDHES